MTQYDENNKGVAFPSSAFTGKINFDGKDYYLAINGTNDKAKFKYIIFIYDRENTYQTVLFDKDKRSANFPNYGGQIELPQGDYWINVWHKKDKNGKYYMSISVTNKNDIGSQSNQSDDLDQEIPF